MGNLDKLNEVKMSNGKLVKDNLITLIAKIGEKITIKELIFLIIEWFKFYYVHSAIEKNIGKIVSIVKLEGATKGKMMKLEPKLQCI